MGLTFNKPLRASFKFRGARDTGFCSALFMILFPFANILCFVAFLLLMIDSSYFIGSQLARLKLYPTSVTGDHSSGRSSCYPRLNPIKCHLLRNTSITTQLRLSATKQIRSLRDHQLFFHAGILRARKLPPVIRRAKGICNRSLSARGKCSQPKKPE